MIQTAFCAGNTAMDDYEIEAIKVRDEQEAGAAWRSSELPSGPDSDLPAESDSMIESDDLVGNGMEEGNS
jgi:hypothetical protein